jgi:transposase
LTVNYCGIDIGGLSSYVYVSDAGGRKKWNGEVKTSRGMFAAVLKRYVRGGLKVAIEAGNQTAWIHAVLVDLGAEVIVVNPQQVKLIAMSHKKTDKVDARILCELLRMDGLPEPVHMPSAEMRGLRGLLAARRQLIQARTKLQNVVRGMLRQEGVQLARSVLSTFKGWKQLLERGFDHDHLAVIVATYYESFVTVTHSIRALDKELAAREAADPRAARLRTMPKVGPVAALTLVSAVDDVTRFRSSRKLVGYSGLAPSVRQSSERTVYGPISRQGRRELRGVWVQVAHLVAIDQSTATRPLRAWFQRVARRRGRKTAIVALARRLLVIAYQLLKHETDYDVSRLKKPRRAVA